MVKLLHTADLHLDSPFSGLTPEEALRRRRLQRQIPMALAERCRAEGCGLWLVAGDVFDGGRLAPETVEALQAAFEHCAVPVLVAPGNHDPYTSDSPWARVKWPGNVHVFSGPWEAVELESLGCRVWGAAFQGREARGLLGFAAAEGGLWEIGVLHGEVAASGAYNPMTEGDIAASGLNYLALGHVHRPQLPRRAGKTWYGWPGVTLGRGFDETGSHGVLLVELAGSDCRSQLLPLPGPQYRVVSVAAGENPLAAAEAALSPEGLAQSQQSVRYYQENARLLGEALRRSGYVVFGGADAPYLWVRCPEGLDGWGWFDRLLRQAQIVCTPGEGFGRCGAGYVRFCAFGRRDEIREAAERLGMNA